ncbi:hypothetical protein [Lactovum odontotermitis]
MIDLTKDKIYEVIAEEEGNYRIVDDSGEDYLYGPKVLEIVED